MQSIHGNFLVCTVQWEMFYGGASFEVLWLFRKVFLIKFGSIVSFGGTNEQSVKVFSEKIVFSTNLQKSFLP